MSSLTSSADRDPVPADADAEQPSLPVRVERIVLELPEWRSVIVVPTTAKR